MLYIITQDDSHPTKLTLKTKRKTMTKHNNNTNLTQEQKHDISNTSSLEINTGHLENFFKNIFVTPYNWSLIVLTFITWFGVTYFGYYNTNFDMLSSITNYVIATSLIAMVVGALKQSKRSEGLQKIAVTTLTLSFLGLIGYKSVNSIFNIVGSLAFVPTSICGFFLLLKNLWLISASNTQETRGAGLMEIIDSNE